MTDVPENIEEVAEITARRARGGCAGCQKVKAIETKLDALINRLDPLIEFATAFMESPAGKLNRALMRRRTGG